jgi:hypothetical protein
MVKSIRENGTAADGCRGWLSRNDISAPAVASSRLLLF